MLSKFKKWPIKLFFRFSQFYDEDSVLKIIEKNHAKCGVRFQVWWFNTKIALTGRGSGAGGKQVNSNSQARWINFELGGNLTQLFLFHTVQNCSFGIGFSAKRQKSLFTY